MAPHLSRPIDSTVPIVDIVRDHLKVYQQNVIHVGNKPVAKTGNTKFSVLRDLRSDAITMGSVWTNTTPPPLPPVPMPSSATLFFPPTSISVPPVPPTQQMWYDEIGDRLESFLTAMIKGENLKLEALENVWLYPDPDLFIVGPDCIISTREKTNGPRSIDCDWSLQPRGMD